MEDRIAGHSPAETITGAAGPPVAWRDLRDWLDLVEANGLLKHIAPPVEADEEMAAITLLATRREDAPALLFEQLAGDRSRSRISLYSMASTRACQEALMMSLETPMVVQLSWPSVDSISTRTLAAEARSESSTRTL